MNLIPPSKVAKLQEALRAKAKGSPTYRFYMLYDKVYREDVLRHGYACCKANGGAAGVDGQTFVDIEKDGGLERWLAELAEDLRKKTYKPKPVRRAWIAKGDGKRRPLGIPTVRDRVVQMAAVLVLEPIFETDLQPEQYAYRSGRGALDAIQAVHGLVNGGYTEVVDADLSGYFDTIPHHELMKSVARRLSDRHLLHLIKMWLEMPVEEKDGRGGMRRTTRNRDEGRGTPQGAVISPLLANLYMRRFVLGWKTLGHGETLDAKLVNYADDFVICCRGTGEQALAAMRDMMTKLRLTVNESKTRLCRLPEETFDFLGYTIGRCYSPSVPGYVPVGEAGSEAGGHDQRSDRATHPLPRASGVGEPAQREDRWVGALFSSGSGQQGLRPRESARVSTAPTVAVPEVSRSGIRPGTVLGQTVARGLGPGRSA